MIGLRPGFPVNRAMCGSCFRGPLSPMTTLLSISETCEITRESPRAVRKPYRSDFSDRPPPGGRASRFARTIAQHSRDGALSGTLVHPVAHELREHRFNGL